MTKPHYFRLFLFFFFFVHVFSAPCAVVGAVDYTVDNFPRTLHDLRVAVNAAELPLSSRVALLNATAISFEEVHAYISLLRNVRRVDPSKPLRRLMRLRHRLVAPKTPFEFHMAVRRIMQRSDDLHAQYLPPQPLRSARAVLEPAATTRLFYAKNSTTPRVLIMGSSVPGHNGIAVVTHVDGVPVLQAVRALGRAGYFTNDGADVRRGVQMLSERFLALEPFPRNTVTYTVRAAKGGITRLQFGWSVQPVVDPGQVYLLLPSGTSTFVPESPPPSSASRVITPIPIAPPLSLSLSAYTVTLKQTATTFGVLRTRAFNFLGFPPVIGELSRVLALMPPGGLVVDVRGDLGGQGDAALVLAELVTNASAPPLRGQIRVSRSIEGLLTSRPGQPVSVPLVQPFIQPFMQAKAAGEFMAPPANDMFGVFTGGRRPRAAQVYKGPVVTLTDAKTYSAGELLVTLLKDLPGSGVHVIGMDDSTGGGACGPLRHSELTGLFPDGFSPLPDNLDFSNCITRYFRTGTRQGEYIEQYGIEPHERYYPTRRDAAQHDADLFEYLGGVFASRATA